MPNLFDAMGGFLKGPVGNNRDNDPEDILRTKRNFKILGLYEEETPSKFIDQKLTNAIATFQKEKNLRVDGYMEPNGETENTLHVTISDIAQQRKTSKGGVGYGEQRKSLANNKTEAEKAKAAEEEDGHDCSRYEETLNQALETLNQKEQELKDAMAELQPLQDKLEALENDIAESEASLAATKKAITAIGVVGGALGGGLLGKNPGTMIGGALGGAKLGGEIADAASEAIESHINILRQKHDDLLSEIAPYQAKAEAFVEEARAALNECQGS